jgi:hypothetical protein
MKFSELLDNKFIRITLMIFFFLFVYNILFAIGIFFAIDSVIISMYLCWLGMIIMFAALLQTKKTTFNVTPPLNPIENVIKQASEVAGQAAETVGKAAETAGKVAGTVQGAAAEVSTGVKGVEVKPQIPK